MLIKTLQPGSLANFPSFHKKADGHLGSSALRLVSRSPEEVTHEGDVVRGVSHAWQSLVRGDLLVGRQRNHLLHLHKQQRLGPLLTFILTFIKAPTAK